MNWCIAEDAGLRGARDAARGARPADGGGDRGAARTLPREAAADPRHYRGQEARADTGLTYSTVTHVSSIQINVDSIIFDSI